MSMSSWHTYGYGICVDDINTTADKLRNLIRKSDTVYATIRKYIAEARLENEKRITDAKITEFFEKTELDELLCLINENDETCRGGIAAVLNDVMTETTHIPFITATDCDTEREYVIMPAFYPWEVNNNPSLSNITDEDALKDIFASHVKMLTEQSVDDLEWGAQEIEGWG